MKIKTCGLFIEEDINYANKLKPNLLNSLVYNTQNISSYSPKYGTPTL